MTKVFAYCYRLAIFERRKSAQNCGFGDLCLQTASEKQHYQALKRSRRNRLPQYLGATLRRQKNPLSYYRQTFVAPYSEDSFAEPRLRNASVAGSLYNVSNSKVTPFPLSVPSVYQSRSAKQNVLRYFFLSFIQCFRVFVTSSILWRSWPPRKAGKGLPFEWKENKTQIPVSLNTRLGIVLRSLRFQFFFYSNIGSPFRYASLRMRTRAVNFR